MKFGACEMGQALGFQLVGASPRRLPSLFLRPGSFLKAETLLKQGSSKRMAFAGCRELIVRPIGVAEPAGPGSTGRPF